jgi:hypothetical protein
MQARVTADAASGRRIGSRTRKRTPSVNSSRTLARSSAGASGGSGARIAAMNAAENRNETASMRIVTGPVTSCTSQPERLNPPTSATELLAASLLFPSSSWSLFTSVGR